jgi:Fe-S-cluster containining protein
MPAKNVTTRQSDFFPTCGNCRTGYGCCFGTRPPVSRGRRRIIRKYLREHGIAIADPFVTEEYVYPRETADGFCVFHDHKTKKCLIHNVKPETCVAGPITFDINRKRGKIVWFIKKEKICSLAGVIHRDRQLLQKHVNAAGREIRRLLRGLEAKALLAILLKEEPETVRIGEEDVDQGVLSALNVCERKR